MGPHEITAGRAQRPPAETFLAASLTLELSFISVSLVIIEPFA